MDEGELRERFPEIPWDQPVEVKVAGMEQMPVWVCRVCIALQGLRAVDLHPITIRHAFYSRDDCLVHIEATHHER